MNICLSDISFLFSFPLTYFCVLYKSLTINFNRLYWIFRIFCLHKKMNGFNTTLVFGENINFDKS